MIYVLISITLLAAMSPGPDFFLVMKNALQGKLSGYAASLGIASAILVHVTYCIAGVGLVISQSIILFQVIKILGALYLLYLSYSLLKVKRSIHNSDEVIDPHTGKNTKGNFWSSFQEGFITNALNPKATIFFLSVFSQVISPETEFFTQALYGVIMATTAGVWFIFLTSLINFPAIRDTIKRGEYYINKVFGVVLGILGLKILLSNK